ncbi:MAG: hypothetical protein ACREJN_16130 [Nitrospiraceae bacterium]
MREIAAIDWREPSKSDQSVFILTLELKNGINDIVSNGIIAKLEGPGTRTLSVKVSDRASAI